VVYDHMHSDCNLHVFTIHSRVSSTHVFICTHVSKHHLYTLMFWRSLFNGRIQYVCSRYK